MLVFSLPVRRASQRVEIWRKIQRYGMLPLRSGGYVLPNIALNQERMEWLATAIRGYKGQASVIQAHSFDDLPAERLRQLFNQARSRDYETLQGEIKTCLGKPRAKRSAATLNRLRRRLQEIAAIDFFESPLRSRVETLLARTEDSPSVSGRRKQKYEKYSGRTWITRPRPGIDRVSCAWLIRRFIDSRASFVFANTTARHPGAVPFDMFVAEGFGHRGEDCSFETLCKEFAIRDRRVKRIAEIVHDADLGDERFGRPEGLGLDLTLNGWAQVGISDDELLQRGMQLIEGLYNALSS